MRDEELIRLRIISLGWMGNNAACVEGRIFGRVEVEALKN